MRCRLGPYRAVRLRVLGTLIALIGACAQNFSPNNTSVEELLQQAPQLPIVNLDVGWDLAPGTSGPPQTYVPRDYPSTALDGARVVLEHAQVLVIEVPAGPHTLHGNVTVGPGQVLILQGHGGLLDDNSSAANSTHGVPGSTLVLGNNMSASINVISGGAVFARNVTLVAPRLGPLDTATMFVPSLFVLPSADPWAAALVLESVAMVLDDCQHLRQLKSYVCGMLAQDSDIPWPSVEIELGWMFFYKLEAWQANVSADGLLWACSWPPPRLAGSIREGIRRADAPDAQSVQPLLASQLQRLTPAGLPSAGPAAANTTAVVDASKQLGCAARRVHSGAELQRALVELQALSSQFVVIQVVRNITLQPPPPPRPQQQQQEGQQQQQQQQQEGGNSASEAHVWPVENSAVRVYRKVTVMGRHPLRARVTEIDFNLMRNVFWVEPTGQLRFQPFTLANLPCGPKESFPASLLVAMMWPVAWDRSVGLTEPGRDVVLVKNSTIILPPPQFNYTAYWVGIQASPIPNVRALGSWQHDLAFWGSLAVSNDSNILFLQRRWGAGIQWLNTSLTDLSAVAPQKHSPFGCGITYLVPGDPYFPYTRITPVYNAQQLAVYLENPPNPLLLLVNNITFSGSAAAAALGAGPGGNSSAAAAAGLPLGQAAVAPLGGGNTSAAGTMNHDSSDHVVNVTQGVTVLGWPHGTTVLDLGNTAGLVQLNLPPSQQLALQRLTLAGLGPAAPGQQPEELANITASIWMFNFDRHQDTLLLQNTTLLISPGELSSLTAINSSALPLPSPALAATPPPPLPGQPAGLNSSSSTSAQGAAAQHALQHLRGIWAAGKMRRNTSEEIIVAAASWNGVQAVDVVLTSTLDPALVTSLNITPPLQGLTVLGPEVLPDSAPFWGEGGLGGPSGGPAAAAARQEGGANGLSDWQIALVAVGSGLAVAATLLLGWWVVRRRKRALHQAAKAMASADTLASRGSPSPEGNRSLQGDPDQLAITITDQNAPTGAGSTPSVGQTIASSGVEQGRQQRAAPDDEIRQLVTVQRERSAACWEGGAREGGGAQQQQQDLDVTLEAVLGQGSFGVVYLGRWRGMTVAVKTIMFHDAGGEERQAARQRAINEAAINTLLSHDCICNMLVYDLRPLVVPGLPEERFSSLYRLYIIQEYCDAGSLAQAIDRGMFAGADGRPDLLVILQVAHQVARGLEYIHDNNVIHGDLSSGNIMLRSAPGTRLGFQAKVCDFGLSRFLEGPEQSHISNARQGTPYYMAPEVLAHGQLSREADVFSFGVILWELIHARCPPWRDTLGQLSPVDAAHMRYAEGGSTEGAGPSTRPAVVNAGGMVGFTYLLPHDCPPAYAALVTSCLRRIPKARPCFKDVVSALGRLMGERGLVADVRPSAPLLTTWPGLRRPAARQPSSTHWPAGSAGDAAQWPAGAARAAIGAVAAVGAVGAAAAGAAALPAGWAGLNMHSELRLQQGIMGGLIMLGPADSMDRSATDVLTAPAAAAQQQLLHPAPLTPAAAAAAPAATQAAGSHQAMAPAARQRSATTAAAATGGDGDQSTGLASAAVGHSQSAEHHAANDRRSTSSDTAPLRHTLSSPLLSSMSNPVAGVSDPHNAIHDMHSDSVSDEDNATTDVLHGGVSDEHSASDAPHRGGAAGGEQQQQVQADDVELEQEEVCLGHWTSPSR